MRPPRQRYSFEQIAQAGRWAWASSRGDEEPDFSFDGVSFWHEQARGHRSRVAADAVPREGWWHAKDCACDLCRPSPRRS